MSIEACIAHAIHSDLDILEALPEVHEIPVEELEPYIERYVLNVQESMYDVIAKHGDPYIRSNDAAGLCATCLQEGLSLPAPMLLKMCQTILELHSMDAEFILDTEEGASLYYVKMEVA